MNEKIMKTCELCGVSFNKNYNHKCDDDVLYSRAKEKAQYDEEQRNAEYNAIHEGENF